jgi:signal transduction histidine kinase
MSGKGELVIVAENYTHKPKSGDHIPEGDYIRISVTDSGQGIPPDLIERVFEPFFTTKAEGKGTGLGLSMVYGFIKQSQGQITITSEPGQGTTVSLLLPAKHARATA